MRMAVIALLAAVMLGGHALAQGGGGGWQRAGGNNPDCGRELVVVRADGRREQHATAEAFLDRFPKTTIDQGEQPRDAVALAAVLSAYDSSWVELLDCDNRSLRLPAGVPPLQPAEYFVITGRGGLKSVQEVRAGHYRNTAQQVRKLTFHGAKAAGRAEAK